MPIISGKLLPFVNCLGLGKPNEHLWRNAPGLAQRFTGAVGEVGELAEDGSTWQRALELTYTRAK